METVTKITAGELLNYGVAGVMIITLLGFISVLYRHILRLLDNHEAERDRMRKASEDERDRLHHDSKEQARIFAQELREIARSVNRIDGGMQ